MPIDHFLDEMLPAATLETVLSKVYFRYAFEAGADDFDREERCQALRERAAALGVKKSTFDQRLAAYKRAARQEAQSQENAGRKELRRSGGAYWLMPDGSIDEPAFCEQFLADSCEKHLVCIHGLLYRDGVLYPDAAALKAIQDRLAACVSGGLARKAQSLLCALKNMCYRPEPEPVEQRVELADVFFALEKGEDGKVRVSAQEYGDLDIGYYRLPIDWHGAQPAPRRFLHYLHDLLEPADIATLQEFLGYCLAPTNRAQKMLFLIGSGGEGKSVLGTILHDLFGDKLTTGSLSDLEDNRFARAALQGKLLFLDDDLASRSCRESRNLKELITCTTSVRVERKGLDAYEIRSRCRFIAFGNHSFETLFDHSDGAFRRRIVLHTKPRPKARRDDPALAQTILREEREGIFAWMLAGLVQLMEQNWQFTISDSAAANLAEQQDSFSPLAFIRDDSQVMLGEAGTQESSADLYTAYCAWCEDNALDTVSRNAFINCLKERSGALGITYCPNVMTPSGKRVRGFRGISLIGQPVRISTRLSAWSVRSESTRYRQLRA